MTNKRINIDTLTHMETLTQNVLGIIISFIILHLFGMTISESIMMQSVFFVTSYIRSFLVRKLFRGIEERLGNE